MVAKAVIREAQESDLVAVSAFMRAQGQARNSAEYLRHWYFRDPEPGGRIVIGEQEGRIVGMSTMNAHRFSDGTTNVRCAMPQKVLTAQELRGKGLFGDLYRANEIACAQAGAHFFLTVTNTASTPIFLNKFGYVRLPSPRMAVLLPLPGRVVAAPISAVIKGIDPSHGPWCMLKNEEHLQWRYIDHPLREYVAVACSRTTVPLGLLFLKRVHKKGVPVMLLMDAVPAFEGAYEELIRAARRLTWRHRAVTLLCLEEERLTGAIKSNGPLLRRSSGFNLLVKGSDAARTEELRQCRFELAFGDLDFF